MNNILTIDNGNTHPSVGTFDSSGNLLSTHPLTPFLSSHNIQKYKIILANVGRDIPQLNNHTQIVRVGKLRKNNCFIDMPIHYSSRLGEDRLVSAYQIYKEGHERSILIDVGTFLTIDLVDRNGFQGGYIFPGLQTFLNAYATGSNLPQLKSTQICEKNISKIPRDTSDALLNSSKIYFTGVFKEILSSLPPIPQVLLTGGGASWLIPIIRDILPFKNSLTHRPHLMHQALYQLHEY